MNRGIDLVREQLELRGDEELYLGSASPICIYSVPLEDRTRYLPDGERQDIGDEKQGCVSRGYCNIAETKFTYAYQNNLITPENKLWLETNGYVVDGKIAFSDAYIEILSGTTKQGNSLKAPAHAIHTYGLVPKKLLPQLKKWDDHYNPKRITPTLKTLGEEFARRFHIRYSQVRTNDFEDLLKTDMANIAVAAWPTPINGEYPRNTSLSMNHAVMAYGLPKTYIFDNYEEQKGDFIKKLASDFLIYEYGYRIYVSKETTGEQRSVLAQVFNALFSLNLLSYFEAFFNEWEKPTPKPVAPPPPPPEDRTEKLRKVAIKYIGTDASPQDQAPDYLGCAESVSRILRDTLGTFPIFLATKDLHPYMLSDLRFKLVQTPRPGTIIISPTEGSRTGHVGIFNKDNTIMSNTSKTGRWEANYTLPQWKAAFETNKKLSTYYYELT